MKVSRLHGARHVPCQLEEFIERFRVQFTAGSKRCKCVSAVRHSVCPPLTDDETAQVAFLFQIGGERALKLSDLKSAEKWLLPMTFQDERDEQNRERAGEYAVALYFPQFQKEVRVIRDCI